MSLFKTIAIGVACAVTVTLGVKIYNEASARNEINELITKVNQLPQDVRAPIVTETNVIVMMVENRMYSGVEGLEKVKEVLKKHGINF